MPLEELVAGAGMLAVIAYAVLGGADFGGGIWDLFARGPRREAQRDAIAHAMSPVWEANHVWLIFVIVILGRSRCQAAGISPGRRNRSREPEPQSQPEPPPLVGVSTDSGARLAAQDAGD